MELRIICINKITGNKFSFIQTFVACSYSEIISKYERSNYTNVNCIKVDLFEVIVKVIIIN